ncbi:MAG: PAS domain-containing protein, partial [Pseudomonadota bacterium]|nr:PAS domain-containing protein [Pseudomonadota bacterium]
MSEQLRRQTAHARVDTDTQRLQRSAVTDVAGRGAAQAAVSHCHGLVHAVAECTDALISAKDLEGRYVLANRQFCEVYHATSASVLGRTDHQLFAPDLADALWADDRRVEQRGETLRFEELALLPDGPHYLASFKCPLAGADGGIVGVLGLAIDITGRKALEAQVRAHQAQAELLDRIIDVLASPDELAGTLGDILRLLETGMPVELACVFCTGAPGRAWLATGRGRSSHGLAERLGFIAANGPGVDSREFD